MTTITANCGGSVRFQGYVAPDCPDRIPHGGCIGLVPVISHFEDEDEMAEAMCEESPDESDGGGAVYYYPVENGTRLLKVWVDVGEYVAGGECIVLNYRCGRYMVCTVSTVAPVAPGMVAVKACAVNFLMSIGAVMPPDGCVFEDDSYFAVCRVCAQFFGN